MNLILPVLFGIESVAAAELRELGYDAADITLTPGQVKLALKDFDAVRVAVARLNFRLRTVERVLLELCTFEAATFDELFDQAEAFDWSRWLEPEWAIHVNGYSRKSQLFGIPACQRIIKKAIVTALLRQPAMRGRTTIAEDASRGVCRIQFSIINDQVTLMLDTSGEGLHKRGYRPLRTAAPVRETLAAAILQLSFYSRNLKHGEVLLDPFCGSGTLPIEAALIASQTAPGIRRHFTAEKMSLFGKPLFDREREFAKLEIQRAAPDEPLAFGSDIVPESVAVAEENARQAGVAAWCRFRTADVRQTTHEENCLFTGRERLLYLCNPPYGERLLDQRQAEAVLVALGRQIRDATTERPKRGIRLSLLTSDRQAENHLGLVADKRRKLYNGMIPCTLYMYYKLR